MKTINKILILFFALSFEGSLEADLSREMRKKNLLESQTLEALEKTQNLQEKEEFQRQSCRVQIKKGVFPLDCYRMLKKSKTSQAKKFLNERCFQSKLTRKQKTSPVPLFLRPLLSETCLNKYRETRENYVYQMEEEQPFESFLKYIRP